ncbi:MAG TPA: Lpg1974 family pore-forming outer membrane protein, partial [Gammaproteobacteria bacterium]|nr:Lpg1974 family pore-forming outer membrane protein [Gammaproteobacteria bacterium]
TVTNLRANIGVDYVFFDEDDGFRLGLELGYLVDYYADAIHELSTVVAARGSSLDSSNMNSLSFSGPYLNVKGAF